MSRGFPPLPDRMPARATAVLSRAAARPCPICETCTWNMPHFSFLPISDRGNVGPIRVLIVSCQTCGYTQTFDATLLGLTSDASRLVRTS